MTKPLVRNPLRDERDKRLPRIAGTMRSDTWRKRSCQRCCWRSQVSSSVTSGRLRSLRTARRCSDETR